MRLSDVRGEGNGWGEGLDGELCCQGRRLSCVAMIS